MEQWAVGRILEDARKRAGLSGRAAARASGVSPSWWRFIEEGFIRKNGIDEPTDPPLGTVIRLATAVGADTDAIIDAWPTELTDDDLTDAERAQACAIIEELDRGQLHLLRQYLAALTAPTPPREPS